MTDQTETTVSVLVTFTATDDALDLAFPARPAGATEGDDGATTAEVAAETVRSYTETALRDARWSRDREIPVFVEVAPTRRPLPPEPLADRVAEFRSWVNRTLLGAGLAEQVVQFDDEDLAPWCGYVLGVHDDRPAA